MRSWGIYPIFDLAPRYTSTGHKTFGMSAAKYDLIISEGAGLSLSLVYKDNAGTVIDISAKTPRIRITDNVYDETTDTFNGTLTTDGTDGAFTITVSSADIDALGFRDGRFIIDLVEGTTSIQLVYGKLKVKELKY